MKCILCDSENVDKFYSHEDKNLGSRNFLECSTCDLIFLTPEQRLSPEAEQERYDLHQNSPMDSGYVNFLNQLAKPMVEYLPESAKGIDYGCGPGPTLAGMLEEKGYQVKNYDPIYYKDAKLLTKTYDFVTCTETIEHFYNPRAEFLQFNQLLKNPGGVLGLMTKIYDPSFSFADWWYHTEPTHVSFYKKETFQWLSRWLSWELIFPQENVIIFKVRAEKP